MAYADGTVLPNPAIPKTLGILNVIFSVALTALGLCGLAFILMVPQIQQLGQQQAAQVKAAQENERAAELKALDDRAAAATTDEDKATIARERDEVTKRPAAATPPSIDFAAIPTDSKTVALAIATTIWGQGLAILLLVSGIGLIRLRGWGRKLCLVWAGLQIATTVGLTSYQLISNTSRAAGEAQLAKLREDAAKPNAPPQAQAALQGAEVALRFTPVFILGGALAQITYPIICLILLNTPRARAACLPGASAYDPAVAGGFPFPPGT